MPDTFEAVSQKLMENETAIGRLYELFSRTFPQDAELWTSLAQDEHRHAMWIRHALETVTPEQRQKNLLSIRVQAIETMLQYVASIAGRCRLGELTRLTALALARDLENSLIESKLLGTLSSGAARLAAVEKTLVEQTAEHRKKLAEAFERVRQAR
jgi:rubrerythrin